MVADPRSYLDEMSRGFQHSMILLTAVHLGVFSALGERRLATADLARELGLDARALETILLALTADGFLMHEDEAFRLNPNFAPYLLPDSPETMASILGHNYHLTQRWAKLAEIVRTGRPAVRDSSRPEAEREMNDFIRGMANISRRSSAEVAEKLNLTDCRRLLDLGGGPGTAAIAFARKNSGLRCVVFDLPGPLGIAREEIAQANVTDRVTTQPGDYFVDEFGADFDAVYISSIIHSMGPDDTRMLIEKSHRALNPGGRLIIKEFFLEDSRTSPVFAAIFSVNMLVGTERGRSYTLAETREMMSQAGFGNFETAEVAMSSRLLIGVKK